MADKQLYYRLKVAGIERDLPICPLNDKLSIGAFVMFGDVELTEVSAAALVKLAPEHDAIITAESKGIPLVYEMTRILGRNRYLLARKMPKLYMRDVKKFDVKSITTSAQQTLYLDGYDVEWMKGKKILIVDDVISTGASLAALEHLVTESGGIIAGKMAVLAEGDAIERKDITVLGKLPLFTPDGKEI